jgi:C4-dicarboxylate-specific signal transduction histidine kinase
MLAGIAASSFFVRRHLASGGPTTIDDCIKNALDLIDRRVQDAVALVAQRPPLPPAAATELALADVVNDLLASIATPSGVRLSGPKRPTPTIVVLRDDLELALYCLIENAIESVASKGTGTVRVRLRDHPEGCRVVVLDDGPGIAPTVLDQVFEPFLTTKEGRLGMGLTIAQRLCGRLGGGLALKSTPCGARATFAIARSTATRTSNGHQSLAFEVPPE